MYSRVKCVSFLRLAPMQDKTESKTRQNNLVLRNLLKEGGQKLEVVVEDLFKVISEAGGKRVCMLVTV